MEQEIHSDRFLIQQMEVKHSILLELILKETKKQQIAMIQV